MRRIVFLAFLYWLPCTPSILAQSSDQALKDFRAQVLNQRLLLRNFSADPVVRFEWTTTGLASTPPQVRTLGVFTLTSAKLRNDTLELKGNRSILLTEDADKPAFVGHEPVMISISLKGADPTQVLSGLQAQLFFPTLQAATEAIPPEYRQMFAPTNAASRKLPPPRPSDCPLAGANYILPRVISQEAPEFSEKARRKRVSGLVIVLMTVDENGRPSKLWLKAPAGFGLDDQAIKTVSHYTFEPGTCDGVAVNTPLAVEVNFAIR